MRCLKISSVEACRSAAKKKQTDNKVIWEEITSKRPVAILQFVIKS